jgi:Zn-dependent peptidase ImmA (M78 family)/transcriptional regulator with XRE-family HTH domain
MTLTQETIGQRLKEARLNIRLSQEVAAEAIGLDRTALVKIENGARNVSSMELAKLARLYRRDLTELVSEEPINEDLFTLLGRIVGNHDPKVTERIAHALDLLREAVKLEHFLDDRYRSEPPTYRLQAPENYDQAIDQGKELAILERRRLGLGNNAILDVAELIAGQGIWTAAVPLPTDTMGLFVSNPEYGLAVFVNHENKRARRRFSYAHEYAHALVDRYQKPEPSSVSNAKTFTEKRANAFASEFLMPEDGVFESLERMRKRGSTRSSSWTYDLFSDQYVHDEARLDATANRIGIHDVAILAHEFRVSYEMAAIRLKDLSIVRKPALDDLLEKKEAGRHFMQNLLWRSAKEPEDENQPYLEIQLITLAIEAYRRDKISRGRFVSACALAGCDPERILPVTEREGEA